MSSVDDTNHEIKDWLDATRPMRGAVNEALQKLRESIEPAPRVTERTLLSPYMLADDWDDLQSSIERALEEARDRA